MGICIANRTEYIFMHPVVLIPLKLYEFCIPMYTMTFLIIPDIVSSSIAGSMVIANLHPRRAPALIYSDRAAGCVCGWAGVGGA